MTRALEKLVSDTRYKHSRVQLSIAAEIRNSCVAPNLSETKSNEHYMLGARRLAASIPSKDLR